MKANIGIILISICVGGMAVISPLTLFVFLILIIGSLVGLFSIIDQYVL